MSTALRYLFDEHVFKSVARRLRSHGVDAVTVAEVRRRRKPDDEQLQYATAEGRVIVTYDTDYLMLGIDRQTRGEVFSGVIYCEEARYKKRPKKLFNDLIILHGVYTVDDMHNHIEFLK